MRVRAGRIRRCIHGLLVPALASGAASLSVLMWTAPPAAAQASPLDMFLAAATPSERQEAGRAVVQSGLPVDEAYRALQAGRTYARDVPTGRIERQRTTDSGDVLRYFFIVPDSYDPTRRYPVRVYLHGGVSRGEHGRGGSWWSRWQRLAADDHIAVFPASWGPFPWWRGEQVENLRQILAALKREYNIDENGVTVTGVSDGGTGAYFLAFKDTTPWAAFFPFIGSPGVLLNPQVGAEGLMHVANLVNKPLYIVNGETDRLYPVRSVEPYLRSFGAAGVPFEFHPQPGGHDTSFWPDLAENIDEFHRNFPRDPLPDRVLWAAENAASFARAHWIVLEEVGPIAGDEDRADLAALTEDGKAGVVEAVRRDNTVDVSAYHVRRLRILLSPEEFDLSRPVTVVLNGTEVFSGMVAPSLATLMRWAVRDDDRTMLFVAELEVTAPGPAPSRS